jgi:antitoxin PrlF
MAVRRADESGEDPVINAFLAFLATDMERRPGALSTLSPQLAKRVAKLNEGVEVDPDEAIEGRVAF